MFVLDTNILVYHAAGKETVSAFFVEYRNDIFYIPSIVVAEFLSYPLVTEPTGNAFKSFVSQTIVINLDFTIAERAAQVRRLHQVKLIDAVVAKTALTVRAPLVTNNARDFKKIAGLAIITL